MRARGQNHLIHLCVAEVGIRDDFLELVARQVAQVVAGLDAVLRHQFRHVRHQVRQGGHFSFHAKLLQLVGQVGLAVFEVFLRAVLKLGGHVGSKPSTPASSFTGAFTMSSSVA